MALFIDIARRGVIENSFVRLTLNPLALHLRQQETGITDM